MDQQGYRQHRMGAERDRHRSGELRAEPMIALTDRANQAAFIEGLKRSVEVARRLGARTLIAQAGDDLAGKTREEQRAALTETLTQGRRVLKDSGVRLGVEPLNTLIDHVGYFLGSTREGLDVARETGRPRSASSTISIILP
jgi:hydroxypyruvate isomerase